MRNKTHLVPRLSLGTVQWADAEAVAKLIEAGAPPKLKEFGVDVVEFRRRERIQTTASDLRAVVRIQIKNKHPHSTKKHK
jgi:hypothetical protein